MAYTYEQLHHMTIAELRDIAKSVHNDMVQGYTQMNKEHLLPALCKALGVEMHAHHHLAEGFNKAGVKARMKALKAERAKAIEAHDSEKLKALRRELHSLNHQIRANTV
jgi:hypothetical protein